VNHLNAASETPHVRALVVDDDKDSREALAILLTWAGYDVATATNGREALLEAGRFNPAVIFLDIGMPEMNGYEVCRRLRTSTAFRNTRMNCAVKPASEQRVSCSCPSKPLSEAARPDGTRPSSLTPDFTLIAAPSALRARRYIE
jgi:CheY-like chemotaxis protein